MKSANFISKAPAAWSSITSISSPTFRFRGGLIASRWKNYEPVTFQSTGADGRAIYHTNVMMFLGTNFALVGLAMISEESQRQMVRQRLEATGKTIAIALHITLIHRNS